MNVGQKASDLGLEKDEFLELVEIFLESTESDLVRMNSAICAGNFQQVAEAAHSIKGAAGSLGFDNAQRLATTIEMNAKKEKLEGSQQNADGIKTELVNIARILKQNEPLSAQL